MRIGDIGINAAAVEEGRWIDTIPMLGDLRLKVRGLNNRDYRRLQQKLIAALPRDKRGAAGVDIEEQDRIVAECLLRTVLLDWENLTEADGTPIPYSDAKARELLFEPQYAVFREGVAWAASAVADAREADVEDAAKN